MLECTGAFKDPTRSHALLCLVLCWRAQPNKAHMVNGWWTERIFQPSVASAGGTSWVITFFIDSKTSGNSYPVTKMTERKIREIILIRWYYRRCKSGGHVDCNISEYAFSFFYSLFFFSQAQRPHRIFSPRISRPRVKLLVLTDWAMRMSTYSWTPHVSANQWASKNWQTDKPSLDAS